MVNKYGTRKISNNAMKKKKLVLSDRWCAVVERATGWGPERIRKQANQWFDSGIDLDRIKRAFIVIAQTQGKTLYFVSSQGKN